MEIIQTPVKDLLIIKTRIFEDERGFFSETYSEKSYRQAGIDNDFCQDNQSFSTCGVIRGLHFQLAPYSQCKLVSVSQGRVYDVALDLRRSSPTFGKWFGVELSLENHLQFLIPKGFAHGFAVLSPTALFSYKCDEPYNKSAERGLIYNDAALGIDWQIPAGQAIVSEKDLSLPDFAHAEINFE
jgi:dTDP-4-dehydrorhamnose 3,5-epimerase